MATSGSPESLGFALMASAVSSSSELRLVAESKAPTSKTTREYMPPTADSKRPSATLPFSAYFAAQLSRLRLLVKKETDTSESPPTRSTRGVTAAANPCWATQDCMDTSHGSTIWKRFLLDADPHFPQPGRDEAAAEAPPVFVEVPRPFRFFRSAASWGTTNFSNASCSGSEALAGSVNQNLVFPGSEENCSSPPSAWARW
mmetsp:Transcript_48014/g.109020  ORF Transcript_48014/g.109020 Transcript_48014/m.109020 type:complete len:201 (-) Transcript_48014:1268-1870(-)